jgi:DNA topoisomerase-1
MAFHFAKKKDTPYVKDPVFQANFMNDFRRQLPDWCKDAKFEDVDFSQFYARVDEEKRGKESMSKEAKKAQAADRKIMREELRLKYGRATIDGNEVEIANWMVEPPGLFMGRGAHPLRGSWKPRVRPEDVILNLDEESTVPLGNWKKVVHDHESVWFAKWIDRLTEKEKYVWPHESSDLQQSRNKEKYDKAILAGKNLEKVRARILKSMASHNEKQSKIATVCYLIDRLGMRVGDEKDEDEADTVGATTLRVEHLRIDKKGIDFDFLGKDSVRWAKRIDRPEGIVVNNINRFVTGKKPSEEIFDVVNSSMVNRFLSSIVPGTTAKVFRTYHATRITENELRSKDVKGADDLEKRYHAKMANLKAAIWCNHKRTPPKNWEESLKKKERKVQEYKAKGKDERVRKMSMDVDLTKETKEYNLNTSLKNYIDPRVIKSWADYVGLDWKKIYTSSLLRKFEWAAKSLKPWEEARVTPIPRRPEVQR